MTVRDRHSYIPRPFPSARMFRRPFLRLPKPSAESRRGRIDRTRPARWTFRGYLSRVSSALRTDRVELDRSRWHPRPRGAVAALKRRLLIGGERPPDGGDTDGGAKHTSARAIRRHAGRPWAGLAVPDPTPAPSGVLVDGLSPVSYTHLTLPTNREV